MPNGKISAAWLMTHCGGVLRAIEGGCTAEARVTARLVDNIS
jgi:hypothetical protein